MQPDENALAEARNFIDREKDNLKGLLETLRNSFEIYADSPEGKGRIYRIYSRGEKQNGDEFKAVWKIAQKMLPGISPAQVRDIIGLTIVCPFISDLQAVEFHIDSMVKRQEFTLINQYRHEPATKGQETAGRTAYEATHYVLTTPNFFYLCCEVQVKTVLHDAWAAKTHDLSYKPGGHHDQRLNMQMDTLANILTALDKQTEIIRQLAEESWHADNDKKRAARTQLIDSLNDGLQFIPDSGHKRMLEELKEFVTTQRTKITSANVNDNLITEIRTMVGAIGQQHGYERNLCRIVAAIGMCRERNDLLSWILDCVSRWKSAHDYSSVPSPYHFAALILYSCGDLERAIQEGEIGITLRKRYMPEESAAHAQALASSLSSLAYYYAELARTPLGFKLGAESRARAHIAEARLLRPDRWEILDTEGYVLIAFGSELEVNDGLQKCEDSWKGLNTNPLAPVSDLYYRIHRRAAFRRLLEF